MDKITVDERNKKRIQKFIKQEMGFYGYEQDIELLEQNGHLTEELARKVFKEIMNGANRTRTMLEPEEDSEFKQEIEDAFARYDKIPRPEHFEQYGYYYDINNDMELGEIYSNMQIAFELRELDSKYYGCKELRDIASTVINSINGIEEYKIELLPEAKEELQKVQEELKALLNSKATDIQGIQDRIDVYNEHATNIWNDYLTGIDDVENSEYRWVIHNLTKGELEGDFRNKYMSTSLITNNTMGRYGNSNYGLIIKPKHIVSASYRDTYTLNTRDDEENLFNIRPPFMLPQEIEDICIQQTIEENGEMLNNETTPIYSELVVDEYEIEGVYYISYGEKELAVDYERAKKVAEERGLPLIERDISKYRAEHGLEPMTENAKRKFCKNILRKCCTGDRKLEQAYSKYSNTFINRHFQEFSEIFLQLKASSEFSEADILKAFSNITREDFFFGKISQNIDDKYLSVEEKEELQKMLLEKEYGLTGINDAQSLKRKLEKIISDGINYSANKDDLESMKKFGNIKKVMPQFEIFKSIYLQLREMGIEEQLYIGMDFSTISYDEILEKASRIVEENEKAKQSHTEDSEKQQEQIDETSFEIPEEIIGQPSAEKIEIDNGTCRINEFGEIIRENNPTIQTYQQSQVVEEYWNRVNLQQAKEYEQQQQSSKMEMQEVKSQTINLWMNRFDSWYSAIDRVSQNVKAQFVKMKSDIINAINNKIKKRMNKRQVNIHKSKIQVKGR